MVRNEIHLLFTKIVQIYKLHFDCFQIAFETALIPLLNSLDISNMAHKITVIGTIRLNDLQILQITGI